MGLLTCSTISAIGREILENQLIKDQMSSYLIEFVFHTSLIKTNIFILQFNLSSTITINSFTILPHFKIHFFPDILNNVIVGRVFADKIFCE